MTRLWTIWLLATLFFLTAGMGGARAGDPPAWLPRYELAIRLDVDKHLVTATERVTWTNRHQRPARELIFNAHARYAIPAKDIGLLAKTLELLRIAPSEAMSFAGPPLEVKRASLIHASLPGANARNEKKTPPDDLPITGEPEKLPPPQQLIQAIETSYAPDNDTALVLPLPHEIGPGESVTVEIEFILKLPPKKGRWGQWEGITMLAQWLPVLAFYDEKGWQPTPFIPWHQPFFNEAGRYTARITLPTDQKLACTAVIQNEKDLGDGWREIETAPICARDFALIASSRFVEYCGQAGAVRVRCLALPEHAHHAENSVRYACEAIPVYNKWFGPYPYGQFTLVEAFFGWNGNECGGLVMLDERMLNMPHVTSAYLDSLVSHELCHQWWYNVVGTNGYAETWMDEGLATYFSHRLMDQKHGRNNKIIAYPKYLEWMPNIHREDLRNYGYLGMQARGDAGATVQEMPKFTHLSNLMSATYDRGSKVVGMIEQRLGEAAFFDFLHGVYSKYQFQVIRVADFQKELEAYTGRSWDEFFQGWLYSAKRTDWAVKRVEVDGQADSVFRKKKTGEVKVRVWLQQKGDMNEPTVLGIRLEGKKDGYQIRVPINSVSERIEIADANARIEPDLAEGSGECRACVVELTLPCPPAQISVDPDCLLLDSNPCNNHWRPEVRLRLTPLYTQLEEVDVTNAFDRWNFIFGPWFYANAYNDPWFVRSPLIGMKAGIYKTQEIDAGPFIGYRTNDSNIIGGGEFYWDHFPFPRTQVGFLYEHSLVTIGPTPIPVNRGVLYGRYVLTYGSSLYLPPFEYVETFATGGNRSLPAPNNAPAGTDLVNDRWATGIHYHKFFLTPYWDPEGGVAIDTSFQYGFPIFGAERAFQEVYGQVSTVKYLPEWFTGLSSGPLMSYLKETRIAFRLAGAAALPNNGLFFALGGANYFRGYDLTQRQGSLNWVGSVEWRLPVATGLHWDFCDHIMGVRNIFLAPFYDVGNSYVNGHAYGDVAHALGVGLRVDVAWLGLIERTMLRLDVAKTVNDTTPFQFWIGLSHPF
jgi:hypothetical protein